ncbi:HlyD family secretion protein [Sandaracinomonas limnophila]|nr:HlyD family efflux transporter periplasmic adaptor subunit [Sandaracinomonas limnophila]
MEEFKKNDPMEFKSYQKIYQIENNQVIKPWIYGLLLGLVVVLFLPWTQNIKSKGIVTTIKQENRSQEINSPIAGKIGKWWVKEGDFVEAGDTIALISEVKTEYLDPQLVQRTKRQLDVKQQTIDFYHQKAGASQNQVDAINRAKNIKLIQTKNKLQQAENKLAGDKAELIAIDNEFQLAKDQLERQEKMYQQGLVSQTQYQQRLASFRNSQAKKTVIENKIKVSLQEIENVKLDLKGIEQEYQDKVNKAIGDKLSALSMESSAEGDLAKIENQLSNYSIRQGLYYIIAPQQGQIVQAKKSGIGEILKEGESIAEIVPKQNDLAVEMFVRPMDLPLLSKGQKVRFTFDGFPAIVFSGWPQTSYGTFGGKVFAIESSVSNNGMYRVLVAPDPKDRPWPKELTLGMGAQGIALLKDVMIGYELWRNINGFPPDYYQTEETTLKKNK